MLSVKSLIQRLQDVKENQATLSSGTFFFGPPPETGASSEITYPYTGSWLNNSQLNGGILSTSFKVYFADRVNPELNNRTDVLSSLQISAIQFIAQLEYTLKYSYNARLVQNTPLEDFEGRWNDFVTGWECDVTIEQYYNKSVCDIPSSDAHSGQAQVVDQYGNIVAYLNPNEVYTVTNTTDTVETYTVTGTTQAILHTPTFIYGVFMNGQRLALTTDYTISGTTITFVNALDSDSITVVYSY